LRGKYFAKVIDIAVQQRTIRITGVVKSKRISTTEDVESTKEKQLKRWVIIRLMS
jgi:hypothetical protein